MRANMHAASDTRQGRAVWKRGALSGLCGALVALVLLVPASARPAAISPSELLADPDRFDGQAVTLQGTVEKFREGVSPDGAPYYKFRLSDEQTAVRVFSFGARRAGTGCRRRWTAFSRKSTDSVRAPTITRSRPRA